MLLTLSNDKILDVTKLNALNFADDKLNIGSMMISRLHTLGDTVGKGENAGYHCGIGRKMLLTLYQTTKFWT